MMFDVVDLQALVDVDLYDVDAQDVVVDLLLLDEDVEVSHWCDGTAG